MKRHRALAALSRDHHHAIALEAGERAPLKRLQALGLALWEHVRREEGELFPLRERALPDAALRAVEAALR